MTLLEATPPPRPRVDAVLASTLCVAALLHFVALFAWLVMQNATPLFESVDDTPRRGLQSVDLVRLTTRPPGPTAQKAAGRMSTNPHVAAPSAPSAAAPSGVRPARPAPRPAAQPRVAQAAAAGPPHLQSPVHAPTGSISRVPTQSAPSNGTATQPGRASGTGTGATGTSGSGAGQTSGASGTGGGGGTAAISSEPASLGAGSRVHATAWYSDRGLYWQTGRILPGKEPRSWEELCALLGISLDDLDKRPGGVGPFMTGINLVAESEADLVKLVGKKGTVLVGVHVSAAGVPTVNVVRSSGIDAMDRTAALTIARSHWLPARAEGKPVEDNVEFPVTFDEGTAVGVVLEGPPAGTASPAAGVLPSPGAAAPAGRPPLVTPGGRPPGY